MSDPIEQISDILGAPKGWLDRRVEVTRAEKQIDRLAMFIINNIPGEPSQGQSAVDTAIRLLAAQSVATPPTSPRTILQAVLNDVNPAALGDGYAHFLASVRHVGEQFGVEGI
jgi:hypothetical protein